MSSPILNTVSEVAPNQYGDQYGANSVEANKTDADKFNEIFSKQVPTTSETPADRGQRLSDRHAHLQARAPDLLQRAAANRAAGNTERAELLESRAYRVAELEARFDHDSGAIDVDDLEFYPAEPEVVPENANDNPAESESESGSDPKLLTEVPELTHNVAPNVAPNVAEEREVRLADRHDHLQERASDLLQRAAANRAAGNIERAELLESRAYRVAELEARFDRDARRVVVEIENHPVAPDVQPNNADNDQPA